MGRKQSGDLMNFSVPQSYKYKKQVCDYVLYRRYMYCVTQGVLVTQEACVTRDMYYTVGMLQIDLYLKQAKRFRFEENKLPLYLLKP